MTLVYTIIFFVFGLVFGSFYNVVGLRIPKKESIIQPPSHCTNCHRQLTARDLVPVLSYVSLGGKCRSCGYRISWLYLMMESSHRRILCLCLLAPRLGARIDCRIIIYFIIDNYRCIRFCLYANSR